MSSLFIDKPFLGPVAVYIWKPEHEGLIRLNAFDMLDTKTTSTKAMVSINKFANDRMFIYTDPSQFAAAATEESGSTKEASAEACNALPHCATLSLDPSELIMYIGFAVYRADDESPRIGFGDPSLVWMANDTGSS